MSLRDQLSSLKEEVNKNAEDMEESITFHIRWTESCSAEVKCHHEELMSWLKNILNLCQKISNDAELDKYDKLALLNYWLDDLGDIKDEWLPNIDDEDDK